MRILWSVIAFVIIAGTWWSMAEAVGTASLLQATLPHALGDPMPPAGGMLITDCFFSTCCNDFQNALALSIWGTLLGGFPMAGLAFVLRRRVSASLPPGVQPLVMAAFAFQCGAMLLAALVSIAFWWFVLDAPGYATAPDLPSVIFVAYLMLTAIVSARALAAWHNLHSRIAPTVPIALKSEG